MASTGNVGGTQAAAAASSATARTAPKSSTSDLGKDDFLKLMLAQLQHQDPLKPMDDTAFIAQTAQFNALDQMTKLNTTITALFNAQQITEASGMIGKTVSALDTDNKPVQGVVSAASVESGVAMLHVGSSRVQLDKVTAVAATDAELPALGGDATPP